MAADENFIHSNCLVLVATILAAISFLMSFSFKNMSGYKKAFAVVVFLEENIAEVIPTDWIINSSFAKWPNLSSPNVIGKYIQKCKPASDEWISVRIKIYGYSNSFKRAKRMAETTLDLIYVSSDSSEEDRPRKRRKPARYQSSDEETESESFLPVKKFNIPKLPEVGFLNDSPQNYPSVSSLNLSKTPISSANSSGKVLKRVLSDTPVQSKENSHAQLTKETMFAHILEYLEKLTSKFDDLERKIDNLASLLERETNSAGTESVITIDFLPPELQLPIKTEEDLKQLNEILQKKNDLSAILVRYLYSHGNGKTPSSFMLSICRKVLAQEVAMLYSRYGRKGKKPFAQFSETMNVIIAAAACRFTDVDREVLSEMFGKALAGASDWNGRKNHPSNPSNN